MVSGSSHEPAIRARIPDNVVAPACEVHNLRQRAPPRAMTARRKLWLRPKREFRRLRAKSGAGPMSVRVSFGLVRTSPTGRGWAVQVDRLGLGYRPYSHAGTATETKAHFRDPLIVSSSDA